MLGNNAYSASHEERPMETPEPMRATLPNTDQPRISHSEHCHILRHVPRLMALAREMPRLVGATAFADVLSVANPVIPTMATHGFLRILPPISTDISVAIAAETWQSPRTEVRKNTRQWPLQLPRTFNHSNFRGHPRPSAAFVTAVLLL